MSPEMDTVVAQTIFAEIIIIFIIILILFWPLNFGHFLK